MPPLNTAAYVDPAVAGALSQNIPTMLLNHRKQLQRHPAGAFSAGFVQRPMSLTLLIIVLAVLVLMRLLKRYFRWTDLAIK